jgi:hypothetical protein
MTDRMTKGAFSEGDDPVVVICAFGPNHAIFL